MPILTHLGQGFLTGGVSSEYTPSDSFEDGEELKAEMIDDMARRHWPLCMRHLHDNLKKDRHLKHYGRLQYGLFLKVTPVYLLVTFRRSIICAGRWLTNRGSSGILAKGICWIANGRQV